MELVAGFTVGILGSIHCIGMCGPIALALPMSQNSRLRLVLGRILYNLGRATTYAGIGLFAGLVGQSLSLAGFQQAVSVISGVLILIIVLIVRPGGIAGLPEEARV